MVLNKPNRPIRVLHIVTIMNRAGLETMLMNYYRKIDRNAVQFDFLVHRDGAGQYDSEIKSLGGKIYHMPPISLRHIFSYKNKLVNFLKSHPEYKIVHSHLDALSALPLSAAKVAGVKTRIAHSHVNRFDMDLKLPLRLILKRLIPLYTTNYAACSRDAGKFMFGMNKNIEIIVNAIDVDKFKYNLAIRNKIRKELRLDDSLTVGHVGRFDKPKNHLFLIEIFADIVKTVPNSRLVLIGNGPLLQAVKDRAKLYNVFNKVIFLGSRSDVPALLNALDVFMLPSKYEGLGMALIEAQASGLMCVTSEGFVPKESNISGVVSYMPLRDSAEKWANKALELLALRQDRLSTGMSISKSRYNISDSAKALEAYYEGY